MLDIDNIAIRLFLTVERLAGTRAANRAIALFGREVEPCSAACGWCRVSCAH